jgi:hypothetical protein
MIEAETSFLNFLAQQHNRMESNKTTLVPSRFQFSYVVFINDREGEESSALLPTLRKEDIYRAGVAAAAQLPLSSTYSELYLLDLSQSRGF